jgi:hypothetical protein
MIENENTLNIWLKKNWLNLGLSKMAANGRHIAKCERLTKFLVYLSLFPTISNPNKPK